MKKSFRKSVPCATEAELQRYLREELERPHAERIEQHIEGCPRCRATLESAAGEPALWEAVAEHLAERGDAEPIDPSAELREIAQYLAPSDDPAMLGRLGHFEICGFVGRGSTGIVLKAFEARLSRYVAIKLMAPAHRASAVARRRFEREGRAVAAVVNEHVVPVYAVEEYDGLPYIVMQYVAGVSLQQRLEQTGGLGACEVVRIGMQVAKALAAAHAQGIIHRDVKPANVLLETSVDRALVGDFGLARVADEASMTRSGTITGTPQYMSPEQAKGDGIDPRSDLFSLGSLMYAACTGRPPFQAQTVFGVINRVCEATPRPIRETHPELPAFLEALIAKLMAKEPAERFRTAEAAAVALEAELAHLQNPTAVPQPERAWLPKVAEPRGLRALLRSKRVVANLAGAVAIAAGVVAFNDEDSGGEDSTLRGGGWEQRASSERARAAGFLPLGSDELGREWSMLEADESGEEPKTFEVRWSESLSLGEDQALWVDVERAQLEVRQAEGDGLEAELVRRILAGSQEEARERCDHNPLRYDAEDAATARLTLRFDAAYAEREGYDEFESVVLRLAVPQGLTLQATDGNVSIGDLHGDVDVTARGGNVAFGRIEGMVNVVAQNGHVDLSEGCSGGAEVLAIHGDVYLAGVDGSARVRTSNGGVRLGKNRGAVTVQAGGGSVEVAGVLAPTSVFTSDGDILVELDEGPWQTARFDASGGGVRIRAAEHLGLQVQSRGELDSPFEGELRESADGLGLPWTVTELNGGGSVVQAISSTGVVQLETFDPEAGGILLASHAEGDSEGLGGSGLGGSGGLGGSRLGGSGLGGSGGGGSAGSGRLSDELREKLQGAPRPGALVAVTLPEQVGNVDGYMLYLPPSHRAGGERFPVLVYLQGGYGVGGPIEDSTNWGLLRLVRDESDLESERNQLLLDRFIVVAPHIVGGHYHDEPEAMRGILDELIADYHADPDRVYVTGLSRGGHGSWGLAARMPDTFAAIVPIGGSPGAVNDYDEIADSAIWIAHNVGDSIVSYRPAVDAARRIEEEAGVEFLHLDGLDVSRTEYLDHRHLFTSGMSDSHDAWTDIYSRPDFYKWLLAHRR